MTHRKNPDDPVVIKKYANRRLYNTATSSYVTLDHLAAMVREGTDFVVQDAKSGDDITRSVLAQIIFDEESKGQNLLPIRFLRQLIKFYGDSLQAVLPGYLETSLEAFMRNREAFRERMTDAFGGKLPFADFEEMTRSNMAMFERAMRMWNPFAGGTGKGETEGGEPAHATNGSAVPERGKQNEEEIADLKSQLEAMKKQIDELASRK